MMATRCSVAFFVPFRFWKGEGNCRFTIFN
jgi:hypothetical protein